MVVENSNMRGNVGITAMFLLGAVGISGLIISNQMNKSSNMIEESKMQRAIDSASLANLSQLSRLKGLLSIRPTPNLGAGAVAGFYPVNYFSQNWTFERQPGLDINGVSLVDGNTFKIFELPTDFTSSTPSFSQNFSTVTITQQIRDPNTPSLVTHLEVSVSSAIDAGGRTKIDKALVPIDKPKGGNPVLQIFDGGSFRKIKAYESLSTGNRRFRVLADGVVLDAIIYINGNMLKSMVAGYDSSGWPLSHAVSSVGKGQVIGDFSVDLVSLLNPKISESSDLIRYDTWNKECNFNTFDPFGPTELANLQVGLRYADNSTDSQSSLIDIPLLLKVPKGKGSPYNKESQETVDPFNFLDQCPQACDAYGYGTAYGKQDIINSLNWQNYFGKAFFNQLFTGQYQDLLHWTAGGIVGNHYAICDNASGVGENEDPAVRNMTDPDWFKHQDLSAYNMKCQPLFVFARSFCGCFNSDTLITL
ncbi:MAG: hypothetical protein NTX25_01960 [Proteobacteria bacterium]|nr:hypothetical protein [Pseudomonadota bacterium]